MSFDLKISLDDGGAPAAIDRVTGKLEGAETAAKETTEAMAGIGKAMDAAAIKAAEIAGQMTSGLGEVASKGKLASDSLGKLFDIDLGGSTGFATGMEQIDKLLVQGKISMLQYEDAVAKLHEQLGASLPEPALSKAGSLPINELQLQEQLFQRIRGPAQQYAQQVAALEQLFASGRINVAEFDTELGRLNQRYGTVSGPGGAGGMSSELDRQAKILERIHGPLVEYEADLAAIEALYRKGMLSGGEYEQELDRIAKKAGVQYGPVAPGNLSSGGGAQGGHDDLSQQAGSVVNNANMLLAGGVVGMGIQQLGQQIDQLVERFHDIEDVAIRAANSVQRFVDVNHSTNEIIDQQIGLAHELHSTFTQSIGLYGKLAEQAEAMGLSESEVTVLTKEFGEAVQIAGKPLDAADGIMRRFAYSMAAGKVESRELRTIMREMPEIGKIWTDTFHATADQLRRMVADGRVSTEDLVQSLLKGSTKVDETFKHIQITHAQTVEQWMEDEKILSQRYGVSILAGHGAQATVEALKKNDDLRKAYLQSSSSGIMGDLAKAAQEQLNDESQAKWADFFNDLKTGTGAFREFGDAYRKWAGDTAAVRAEVTKINEPLQAAKSELIALNKAFSTGQIDVDSYTKKWAQLQTTIDHGIGPQALKITEPVRQARLEMERFLNEIEAGANVSQAQTRKALAGYQTTIQGFTPEDLKINNPKLDAADQMADLNAKQKEGKITAEAYRREYDALITTMNDGRLPAVIKLWESFTLPLRDWREEIQAANILFVEGRINLLKYGDEMQKLATSGATYLQEQLERLQMTAELQARLQAQTRTALQGTVLVTPDAREQLQRYEAERRRRDQEQRDAAAAASGSQSKFGPGATSFDSVRASVDAMRPSTESAGQEWKNLADQLDRAHGLAIEFETPAVTLKNALADIDVAASAYALTQEQVNALQIRAKDAYFTQSEALRVVKGPLGEYEATLRKLGHQAEDNAISQQKYTDAVRAAKITFLEASGAAKTFSGAMEIEWIKLQQDAEAFGAAVAKMTVDDFGKLNEAIVTAANGGAVAWSQMIDSMVQDLEKLALKMLEIKLIQGVASLFSPAAGAAVGVAAGASGAAPDDLVGNSGMAFATGGSFIVGGSGGTDSQNVNFKATPGEIVTVMRPSDVNGPGMYPWPTGGAAPSQAAQASAQRQPVIQIHNHYDKQIGLAAIDTPAGNRQVLNVLRANPGAVRSYSGTRR